MNPKCKRQNRRNKKDYEHGKQIVVFSNSDFSLRIPQRRITPPLKHPGEKSRTRCRYASTPTPRKYILRLTSSASQHKKIALLLPVPYNYICVSLIRQYCVVAYLPSLPRGAATLRGGTPLSSLILKVYFSIHGTSLQVAKNT